ncbi:MAG: prenyltransferase/squalene oxidase repeat-containing protein [Aureliella sp.]
MADATQNTGRSVKAEDDEFDDEFSFWPLNLVLIILGGTILGVAFMYLDPLDDNLLRNPWTYVVITPIFLMLISVVLSTIVSRIVEKSMQMAFLLSVLVHLFLIIGAMNVVIFSRLWPEVIESIAREREILKRQQLQAPQYHQLSATRNAASRPDYLRYVPTKHTPSELALAESPSVNLARSSRDNLVSPKPELELSANPHILRRKQPIPAPPKASADRAASLSRSELESRVRPSSEPRLLEPAQTVAPPPSLQARALNENRNRPSTDGSIARPLPDQRMAASSAMASAMRAERAERTLPTPEMPLPKTESLAKASPVDVRRPQRGAQIPMLSPASESVTARLSNPSSLNSSPVRRNATSQRTAASPLELAGATAADPRAVARSTQMDVERREQQITIPQTASGSRTEAFARNTAGGTTGPPAASSMPIQGAEQLATTEAVPGVLSAPSINTTRSSARRRGGSVSAQGAPSAPQWNSVANLAGGTSGRSPGEVAQAQAEGQALAYDDAGLTGQGREIQRAQSGVPGPAGTLSGPMSPASQGAAAAETTGETQLAANDAAEGGSRDRRSSASAAIASPEGASSLPIQTEMSRNSELAGRATVSERPTVSEPSQGADSGRERQSAEVAAPSLATVELPTGQVEQAATESQAIAAENAATDSVERRSQRSRPDSSLLAVDAPMGPGGLAIMENVRGDILPRRREMVRNDFRAELEMQRFERQDVGGPLAAGKIAVPTPAFQQRIDRAKDRQSLGAASAEPQSELAIERGLEFLARHQREDGSWRLQDFDTRVLMTSDTAATGLALLAFQGAGYTHKNFKYAEVCSKAIDFLRTHQAANGDLYIKQNPASDQNAWLYSHGIAAIAMCEAYGMTQDPELRDPAQRCIDFIMSSQDPVAGGWRYRPGSGSDTSVSGWFMMALKSGKLAGLDVKETTLSRLRNYLDRSQDPEGMAHLYRYNPDAADTPQQRHGLKPTAVMTSVGLLMRLYTDWGVTKPEMQAGAEYLLDHLPQNGTRERSRRDTYYWYYATQVMFQVGGEPWARWRDSLYPLLLESQIIDGENEGSWDPVSPTPDLWARYGGRLYVTTMNLLSLEVTYRHLPLYDENVVTRQ